MIIISEFASQLEMFLEGRFMLTFENIRRRLMKLLTVS